MSNGENRIATDVVVKLFDTLKDANGHMQKSVEKQTEAIMHLTGLIKEGVQPDEIKKIIESHAKESGIKLDDLDTCTEAVHDRSEEIANLLKDKIIPSIKDLRKWVGTMILVVCVTFSVMTISYFFVKDNVETMINNKIESIEKIENGSRTNIQKQIEELKRLLDEHTEGDQNGYSQ